MLSIIICSRDAQALQAVQESVASTVGVPYEIIAIDNSKGQYGICEAYNVGAARSQYDLLCFMHEDIRFHTHNWGATVAEILADTSIGVLGVAGGKRMIKAPQAWWKSTGARMNVQHSASTHSKLDYYNPENLELEDMAVLDGIWLCSRKEVWKKYSFDGKTFKEFHFYDVDFCTQIFQNYRVCLTYKISIEHFSTGSVNLSWLKAAWLYLNKWSKVLPFGTAVTNLEEEKKVVLNAFYQYTLQLNIHKAPISLIAASLAKCIYHGGFNRDVVWVFKQLIKAK